MGSEFEICRNKRITALDIINAGVCIPGARDFFHSIGINFKSVVKIGISADFLTATNNPTAIKVVKHKVKHGK